MRYHPNNIIWLVGVLSIISLPVRADIVFGNNQKYVSISGLGQARYHWQDPDNSASTDNTNLSVLRLNIEAKTSPKWRSAFQWDFGKVANDNDTNIKDAYFQYRKRRYWLSLGNAKIPFSREQLTSLAYHQLPQRNLVGD